jgi:hypothetical protein
VLRRTLRAILTRLFGEDSPVVFDTAPKRGNGS